MYKRQIDTDGDGIADANYQQLLSQPPYNLNINISQSVENPRERNGVPRISDPNVFIRPTGTSNTFRQSAPR